jgi:hypothetical protein
MAALTLYTPELTWEPLPLIPGDAEVKVLRSEAEGAGCTRLSSLPRSSATGHSP